MAVPAGATSFTAKIGRTSDLGADLDLYVYGPTGALVAQSADGDSEEAVTIANPAAGTYTVEVDGYSVPSGSTQYDYLDAFYSPALGSLNITSAPSVAPGERDVDDGHRCDPGAHGARRGPADLGSDAGDR